MNKPALFFLFLLINLGGILAFGLHPLIRGLVVPFAALFGFASYMLVFVCSQSIQGYKVVGWKKVVRRWRFWFGCFILSFFAFAGSYFTFVRISEFDTDHANQIYVGLAILSGLVWGTIYLIINWKILGFISEYDYRVALKSNGLDDDEIDQQVFEAKLEGLIADNEDFT